MRDFTYHTVKLRRPNNLSIPELKPSTPSINDSVLYRPLNMLYEFTREYRSSDQGSLEFIPVVTTQHGKADADPGVMDGPPAPRGSGPSHGWRCLRRRELLALLRDPCRENFMHGSTILGSTIFSVSFWSSARPIKKRNPCEITLVSAEAIKFEADASSTPAIKVQLENAKQIHKNSNVKPSTERSSHFILPIRL
ncbi:hypothetical protein EVAR_40278_1 [Eumeta japonica]|uniref:Uncharacterized protein n=1 Tax=Eumeta variegata TaxID=151549 RepID=A0A4C1WZL9_EUMVA|nr:hypothetical protein EVAR_40278_1 [Eumeta japonica]